VRKRAHRATTGTLLALKHNKFLVHDFKWRLGLEAGFVHCCVDDSTNDGRNPHRAATSAHDERIPHPNEGAGIVVQKIQQVLPTNPEDRALRHSVECELVLQPVL